jgi:hypothetical protein
MEKRFILTINENGKVSYKAPEDVTSEQFDMMAKIAVVLEPSWVLSFFLRIEVIFYKITWFVKSIIESDE